MGAGTNNARLAGMLRQLGSYYYKEPTLLLLVRVAQGLVHLGKGLLTLNPKHADQQLLSSAPQPPLCVAPARLMLALVAFQPSTSGLRASAMHLLAGQRTAVRSSCPRLARGSWDTAHADGRARAQTWRWRACWWCCMRGWT